MVERTSVGSAVIILSIFSCLSKNGIEGSTWMAWKAEIQKSYLGKDHLQLLHNIGWQNILQLGRKAGLRSLLVLDCHQRDSQIVVVTAFLQTHLVALCHRWHPLWHFPLALSACSPHLRLAEPNNGAKSEDRSEIQLLMDSETFLCCYENIRTKWASQLDGAFYNGPT